MQITEALTGRTVDHVLRDDNGIKLCMTCGREVELYVDENGEIQLKRVNAKIVLPSLNLGSMQGSPK